MAKLFKRLKTHPRASLPQSVGTKGFQGLERVFLRK